MKYTTFPDIGKQFTIWRIGHDVRYAAGQHPNNELGIRLWAAFEEKTPIREILAYIMDRYKQNESEVLDVLGETLIDKIKTVLQ